MEVFEIALEVIDLRSFSNLWYWIALAVLWSSISHWVLGVPHDMIHRARREGGQVLADAVPVQLAAARQVVGEHEAHELHVLDREQERRDDILILRPRGH